MLGQAVVCGHDYYLSNNRNCYGGNTGCRRLRPNHMRRLIIIGVISLLLAVVIGFGYKAYVSHQAGLVSMQLRPPLVHDQGNY